MSATVRSRSIALVAIVLGCAASAAGDTGSKRDGALRLPVSGTVRVIVSTQPGGMSAVAARQVGRGRAVRKNFSLINAIATDATAADLAALEADPAVRRISVDAKVSAPIEAAAGSVTDCTALQATLGLPAQGLTGKGVGVAIVDSGLQLSGDFSGVGFYDFTSTTAG